MQLEEEKLQLENLQSENLQLEKSVKGRCNRTEGKMELNQMARSGQITIYESDANYVQEVALSIRQLGLNRFHNNEYKYFLIYCSVFCLFVFSIKNSKSDINCRLNKNRLILANFHT